MPEKPLRFRPAQHLVPWRTGKTARPYSIPACPLTATLEFHLKLVANVFLQPRSPVERATPSDLGQSIRHFHY